MDLLELFVRNMLQTEGLVPAIREDVKRDLSANREGEAVVRELLPEHIDECNADSMFLWTTLSQKTVKPK